MDDPNVKHFAQKAKDRKHYHIWLWFELLYMVVLMFSVIFNMRLFWRLVSIQAVICLIILIIGLSLNWYDKKTGREIPFKKDREFFWQSFMAKTPIQKQKTIYHTISVIAMVVSFGVALFSFGQIFTSLASKPDPNALGIMENLALYADTFYVLTMAGVLFGLLFGKKRLERNSSVASIFLSLILIAFYPQSWVVYVIGLLTSAAGYLLYRFNQL